MVTTWWYFFFITTKILHHQNKFLCVSQINKVSHKCYFHTYYIAGYFIPISPKLPDPILKIVDNLKKSSIKNILDIEEACGEINKKIAFDMIMTNKAKLHYADDDAVLKAFKDQVSLHFRLLCLLKVGGCLQALK